MEDKRLEEKLSALDTLSGGIVFGKEEAWDKLQARLEKKPARIIPLRTWLAAAAVLLLMMGTVGFYYHSTKEVAQTEVKKQPQQQPLPAYTNTTPANTPSNTPEKQTPSNTTTVRNESRHIASVPPIINDEQLPAIGVTSPNPPDEIKITSHDEIQTLPTVTQMKVVHINQLGDAEQQTEPAPVYNPVVLNTNIVNLNDLTDEDNNNYRLLQNVATHREAFAVNFSFMSTRQQEGAYEANNETTHNHLKLKLN
jgi:hypothetical protein